MNAIFEWIQKPPPEGLVSVTLRFTRADADTLADPAADPATLMQQAGEALRAEMLAAGTDGRFPGATE
jgi:hypothetical protein